MVPCIRVHNKVNRRLVLPPHHILVHTIALPIAIAPIDKGDE